MVCILYMGLSARPYHQATLCTREMTQSNHRIGSWMGLRADLDTENRKEALYLCRESNHGRPVCSQTLLPEGERQSNKLRQKVVQ
jgi:hypothetical protein